MRRGPFVCVGCVGCVGGCVYVGVCVGVWGWGCGCVWGVWGVWGVCGCVWVCVCVLFCFCFCFVLFCFVLYFCFVLFCFCFVFAFNFSKPLKFVLGLPKWKFSTGKKHFTAGKKSGKMTLPRQKILPVTPLYEISHNYLCDILSTSNTVFCVLIGLPGLEHPGRFLLLFFTGFLFFGLYFALFFSTKSLISLSFFLKTLWTFSLKTY